MLLGLADSGAQLELFIASTRPEFVRDLALRPNVKIHSVMTGWRPGRWYSSSSARVLLSGNAERVHVGAKLARRLAQRHAEQPFDVVYRLSQIELLSLRRHMRDLPPIVLHPEVHAHGELRYHWRERGLALRCEPRPFFAAVHALLGYRSVVQRRDMRRAALMIAPSRRFADLLAADCAFPRERIRVIANVVDLDRFSPAPVPPPASPVRLLFISRMSVRKGVEQIVALSHRLADLAGRVQIDCIGGASLFSNYSALLEELHPDVAAYRGQIAAHDLPDVYRAAHAILQPSWYEPFAITVGEAFACGLPVIASHEVGAVEGADSSFCRVHAAGDLDAMEREVRRLVAEVEQGWPAQARAAARSHAEAHLGRDRFARQLVGALAQLRSARPTEA